MSDDKKEYSTRDIPTEDTKDCTEQLTLATNDVNKTKTAYGTRMVTQTVLKNR
jgi:hypothetical protein